MGLSLTPANPFFYSGTRAQYAPSANYLNLSMDFNAAPSGTARGTEVIIPDNASPEVRAAAERYNQLVAQFAADNGIADYPIRGVRTRSENGRGVPHTIHAEPFFNTDIAFQQAVKNNPAAFAALYQEAFGNLPNIRAIAPHGVGNDRGAASDIFGSETDFGMFLVNAAMGNDYKLPDLPQAPQGTQDIADETMAALGKPPIRPQGILSTSSPQTEAPMEEQKATGLLGSLFPNMTADRQDRLAVALSGLSMHPNQGIMEMAGQRMADRREDRKEAKAQAAERQRANVTAQWLAQQPGGQQYAQAIASGALPASAALGMWQAASQGQEPTALMQNVEFIRQQNPGMSFEQALQAARSGQTINVNGQAPAPATGYRNVYDEQGRLVAQEPIPGGPVDTEQRQAAQAQERATQAQESQQQTTDNVVLNQVNAIRGMLDNKTADGKKYMDIIPEVGPLAEFLSSPKLGPLRNQEAVNMRARLGTLQGMVAFDQLRQMREASPTGGALGAISERELDLLSSQLGALEQATDPDLIRETLDLLESVMRKAEAYPNASQFGFGGTSQATPKVRTFNPQTGRLE